MKSKRPWKKHVCIERVEMNSGDVKFRVVHDHMKGGLYPGAIEPRAFESLSETEAYVDAWWTGWWPQQVKKRRPA
jgi:hypothetical protein